MKILIICLPGIGDALMATPMVKILRKHYPKATIDVVCMFDGVKFVFENSPQINSVYRLNLYKQNPLFALSQLLKVRAKKYDISLLTFPSYRKEYHIVQWIIGAKKRIGHKFIKGYIQECGFLDTVSITVDEHEHNVVNNLNLLHGFDVDWKNDIKPHTLSYELHQKRENIIEGKKYLTSLG
jgi:ADP-heptose:LPS heptosyltransferase